MDKKFDNLESRLREKLSQEDVSYDGWNVPSPDVFDKAMVGFPNHKKKDNNRFFFLLLLLPFAIAFFALKQSEPSPILEAQPASHTSLVKNSLTPTENKNSQSLENITSNNSKHHQVTSTKLTTATSKVVGLLIDNESNEGTNQEESASDDVASDDVASYAEASSIENSYSNFANQTIYLTLDQRVLPNKGSLEGHPGIESTEGIPLLSLPSKMNGSYFNEDLRPASLTVEEEEKINETSYPIYVTGTAQGLLSTLNMKSDNQNLLSLTEYDRWYPAIGGQVTVQKHFTSKLYAGIGFGFQSYKNESRFQDKMTFDESQTYQNNQGEDVHQTPLKIYTPMGNHSSQLDFVVNNNAKQGDEIMNMTFINAQLSILSLTPQIGIAQPLSERWVLDGSIGLSYQYITNFEQKFNSQLYMFDKMMNESHETSSDRKELVNHLWSAKASLGLFYSLNDRFSTGITGGYQRSLSPLIESIDGIKTLTHLQAADLGISFRLRIE